VQISQSRIVDKGRNNKLIIEEKCRLRGVNIIMTGDNNIIRIGKCTSFNGNKIHPITLNVRGNRQIIIGEDCMFSDKISLTTTDFHPIKSLLSNERLNKDADINIGNHVWIDLDVLILKGVSIPDHCIIAAKSVVTKNVDESNCIIAGNPAKIVKRNIDWDRK